MADEFQSGLCSGGNSWWNTARPSTSYDMSVSIPSSTATADASVVGGEGAGSFSWTATELIEAKARDETSASNSTVIQSSDHVNPSFMDSSLQLLPSDWTQTLLRNSGRVENSFQAILQEDLSSSTSYIRQDQPMDQEGMNNSSMNQFQDLNHNFLMDSNNNQSSDAGMKYSLMQGCSSGMMQDMFEGTDNKMQNFIYDNRDASNYQSPLITYPENSSELMQTPRWSKFTQLLKSSPPKQQPQQQSNQLQFSNITPFWNPSATGYASAIQPQFSAETFESKSHSNTLTPKSNIQEGFLGSPSSSSNKKASSELAFKKPRIETPSPLPTFKVRKEKLGDRITALQQLVSPFGKTDTASVLHEAIEYIKFLHDQVGVLSTPYLKNGHLMQQHQQGGEKNKDDDESKQLDLRSRGLCLVPLSSTYPVGTETTVDLWHPTFGGTFR